MIFRESETVEMKAIMIDDVKKEITAFANCEGGKSYIGVQDNGEVAGLDDPVGVSLQWLMLVGHFGWPRGANVLTAAIIPATKRDAIPMVRSLKWGAVLLPTREIKGRPGGKCLGNKDRP